MYSSCMAGILIFQKYLLMVWEKRYHLINRLYGVCETICFQKNYQLTHTSYCESRTTDRSTPHSEMRSLRKRRDFVQIIRIANLKYMHNQPLNTNYDSECITGFLLLLSLSLILCISGCVFWTYIEYKKNKLAQFYGTFLL